MASEANSKKTFFAQNLRFLRGQWHLSQYELAKELKIPRDRIKAWELGRGHPKGTDMDYIVRFFGISWSDLNNVIITPDFPLQKPSISFKASQSGQELIIKKDEFVDSMVSSLSNVIGNLEIKNEIAQDVFNKLLLRYSPVDLSSVDYTAIVERSVLDALTFDQPLTVIAKRNNTTPHKLSAYAVSKGIQPNRTIGKVDLYFQSQFADFKNSDQQES